MKKRTLLSALFALFVTFAFAQTDPCNRGCTYGPIQTFTHPICDATGFDSDGNPIVVPTVFVIVNYQSVTCNGVTSLVIDDIVLVDDREAYNPHPTLGQFDISTNCNLGLPLSNTDIAQILKDAENAVVNAFGIQSTIDISFKGACKSWVKLQFPNGAFFLQSRGDLPGADTVYVSDKTEIYQFVTCDVIACCKVTYRYQLVNAGNGVTYSAMVPVAIRGDNSDCASAPRPDYDRHNPKLTMLVKDPQTGELTSVTGTVIEQGDCEISCSNIRPTPYQTSNFTTDVAEKEAIKLELTATPTLFSNYIQFNAAIDITSVKLYDGKGKLVGEFTLNAQNRIETQDLKPGMYYAQVYLGTNEVKTIKVLKQ